MEAMTIATPITKAKAFLIMRLWIILGKYATS